MGIHELELIDLEEEEEQAYRSRNRKASRPAGRRELEEWPMDDWQEKSSGSSRRKSSGEKRRPQRKALEDWEEEESPMSSRRVSRRGESQSLLGRTGWQEENEVWEDWVESYEDDWQEEEESRLRKRRIEKPASKSSKAEEIKKRKKKRKRRVRIIHGIATFFTLFVATVFFVMIAWLAVYFYTGWKEKEEAASAVSTVDVEEVTPVQDIRKWADFYALELERPELAVDLLTVNEYSRPGEELPEVKSIFIHYTANAGTTAEQNRSYFESLAESHERSASAHFVIGFDGTIVQCIPTKEIAYAVKGRNYDSISIECCYINENGKFESATYNSLIELTAWLLHKYELEPGDVLRHYDEGGKNCPKYYVEHEDAWNRFLGDLEIYMRNIS